jgi:hypothetical protein
MSEAVSQGENTAVRIVLSPDEGETVWLRHPGLRSYK